MSDSMRDSLQSYCRQRFPDRRHLQVKDFLRVTAGWENEVYAFDLEYGAPHERQREELILRIYPGDHADRKSQHEFDSMRKLHKAGYPVPYVHMLERADSPFGKPCVIMERIQGQVMSALLAALPEADREPLRALFCRHLVWLHNLDWRPFAEEGADYKEQGPYVFVDAYLAGEREVLKDSLLSDFLPVLEWLERRREDVPCVEPSVMHGDFHVSNLLVRENGSVAVIDWTGCQVSDPRMDLALTLLAARGFGTKDRRNYYLREYERLVGGKVEHIEWFETLACLWRLRTVLAALSKGPEKLGWRPDADGTIRQQMGAVRQMYDVLLERTNAHVPQIESLLASVL
jgi:aminoglycoside phosphotransferase (APT) family kinase protein